MSKMYVFNFEGVENKEDLAEYLVNYVVRNLRDELMYGNVAELYCNIAREVLRSVECKATELKPELGQAIEQWIASHSIKIDPEAQVEIKTIDDVRREFHVEPAEYYAMKAVIDRQNQDLNDLKNLIIKLTKERLESQRELNSLKGECPRDAIC